jgi:excisionase family DNA binding protein
MSPAPVAGVKGGRYVGHGWANPESSGWPEPPPTADNDPGSRPALLTERNVEMEKLLLTPEEAAEALSIGRSKLYTLIATGDVASVRIGASRRIPWSALVAYVETLADRPSTNPAA